MLNYVYRIFKIKRLTYRLFFWMILFLVFSSSIFLVFYISTDREERISRAEEKLMRTIDNQQGIIESWANKQMEQLSYFSELKGLATGDKDAIYEAFETFTSFSLDLDALFYVNVDGDIVIDSTSDSIEPSYELNLTNEPYFIASEQGRHLKDGMFIQLRDEESIILFPTPVYDEDGQFNGIVLGTVDLHKMNDLLKFTNLGITGETFIVNQEAELLLDVVHEEVERKQITKMSTSVTDAILHEEAPPRIYQNMKGEKVLGHYTPLLNGLFYVIHEVNVNEVLTSHKKMVRTISIIGVVISLVGLLLVWLILKDTQKSIASFTKAIQTIREGDYEYKIDCTLYKNSSLEIQESIEIFNSMTDTIRDKNEALIRLSETDPLTGVYNRRIFMLALNKHWIDAAEEQQSISLAFIDIDYFKQLNDTYGHLIGDDVLIKVTEIIEKCILETTGTLYRYGGEEFIVLFPETDEETAYTYAETIRKEIEGEQFIVESNSKVTVSIGVVSRIPTNENGIKEFIQDADNAVYQAKRTGKNQVQTTF